MTPEKKARVARFLNDSETSETIRTLLEDSFLKARGNDIHILAASRLSIDFLRDAWKDMEKCRIPEDRGSERINNAL